MRGLYAIVDTRSLNAAKLPLLPFVEALLRARPAAIQLRDKGGGARETLAALRQMQPLCRAAEVPLFANDRPDLALLVGASGVHVGQDDLPVPAVREIAKGRLVVGISTHSEAQIEAALEDTPDYIAMGPIFATQSKEQADPCVGVENLVKWAAFVRSRRPQTPVVAIGGITLDNAATLREGCDMVAVIGALLPQKPGDLRWTDEVTERARALHTAMGGPA